MSGWNCERVAAREESVADQLDDGLQLLVALDEFHRAITRGALRRDFVRLETEQEEVLDAHFFADLDVGAIHRADGERAVHLELHVAGAGRFLAGGGDLLGEIRGRVDASGRWSR